MVHVCYLRLLLGLKLFPVAYYNGWQGWTWIMKLKKNVMHKLSIFNTMPANSPKKNYYC